MSKNTLLDSLDQKLLSSLDYNSRLPSTQVAKKLRTSREVVDYRTKRLIEKKFIRSFYTHIHIERFGYTSYHVYVKLKGMDDELYQHLIDDLCSHPCILWVQSGEGSYDLVIQIAEKDIYQLNAIIKVFLHKYDSYFIAKDVTLVTAQYHCKKQFLSTSKTDPVVYGKQKGHETLDKLDFQLLQYVSNNAKMSIVELSQKLHSTVVTITRRLKSLQSRKIIEGHSCTINAKKLGIFYCKLLFALHFDKPARLRELKQYCLQHKHVVRYVECIGAWDFELDIMTPDLETFHEVFSTIKKRFASLIKDYEQINISQSYKYTHMIGAKPSTITYT